MYPNNTIPEDYTFEAVDDKFTWRSSCSFASFLKVGIAAVLSVLIAN